MKKIKAFGRLWKDAFRQWLNDQAPRLAAALSYYVIFSLAPLLLIAIAVAGLVYGEQAAQEEITEQLRQMLGPQAASLIHEAIEDISRQRAGIIATVVGLVTLFIGASGVFWQLKKALNMIWDVAPPKGKGILNLIFGRLLAFAIALVIGFLLLLSLILSAALSAVSNYFSSLLPGAGLLWYLFDIALSITVITILFATMFKILPDAKIRWRDVWVGAFMTAILFVIGKFLIGLYLGTSTVGSAYGAAGSLIVILIWFNYSAQIFLLGAEFTKVYAERYGADVLSKAELSSNKEKKD